jgi:hypothetical protein
MDRFIAQENIKHFSKLLREETDPKKREILRRLLHEEEIKLEAAIKKSDLRAKDVGS